VFAAYEAFPASYEIMWWTNHLVVLFVQQHSGGALECTDIKK